MYYRDMTCFDELHPTNSLLLAAQLLLGQNIDISFGPNGALLGAR